jgi:hypothetical protein
MPIASKAKKRKVGRGFWRRESPHRRCGGRGASLGTGPKFRNAGRIIEGGRSPQQHLRRSIPFKTIDPNILPRLHQRLGSLGSLYEPLCHNPSAQTAAPSLRSGSDRVVTSFGNNPPSRQLGDGRYREGRNEAERNRRRVSGRRPRRSWNSFFASSGRILLVRYNYGQLVALYAHPEFAYAIVNLTRVRAPVAKNQATPWRGR